MKKLNASLIVIALLVGAICIAGCTGPAETNQDASINGTVADVQLFNNCNIDDDNFAPTICRITLTSGAYFTETGMNAETIASTVYKGQSFAFYIRGGHIVKIIEIGNTPVPAVYHFKQLF
ncbi:MAG: hypothetical protein WC520_03395 [Candidatus Paceibacterota bacterium]